MQNLEISTESCYQRDARIAEAQPVGFALVRRDSANHASMLALAASSVLAQILCKVTNFP